jgi:hypothetical protein
MVSGLIIIGISFTLLVYWLRYTCLLLLRREVDGGAEAVLEYGLSHPLVRVGDGEPLSALERALDQDYRVLSYLIGHAAAVELNPLEHRLLAADFRLMHLWYRLTSRQSPARARRALDEMSAVVCFLAQRVGERAVPGTHA